MQIVHYWLAGFFVFVFLFSFSTLNVSCHFFPACKESAEKSTDSLMMVLLYVTSCFSPPAFNNLFLSLTFDNIIVNVSGWFSLDLSCLELSGLPGTLYLFLSPVQGDFQPLFIEIIFLPLSLLLFWDPYHAYTCTFDDISQVP